MSSVGRATAAGALAGIGGAALLMAAFGITPQGGDGLFPIGSPPAIEAPGAAPTHPSASGALPSPRLRGAALTSVTIDVATGDSGTATWAPATVMQHPSAGARLAGVHLDPPSLPDPPSIAAVERDALRQALGRSQRGRRVLADRVEVLTTAVASLRAAPAPAPASAPIPEPPPAVTRLPEPPPRPSSAVAPTAPSAGPPAPPAEPPGPSGEELLHLGEAGLAYLGRLAAGMPPERLRQLDGFEVTDEGMYDLTLASAIGRIEHRFDSYSGTLDRSVLTFRLPGTTGFPTLVDEVLRGELGEPLTDVAAEAGATLEYQAPERHATLTVESDHAVTIEVRHQGVAPGSIEIFRSSDPF